MYTKQEISRQREAFWTTFGKYMQPILSADGLKINWVNYKTGISGIGFKMDADNKTASVCIVIQGDELTRQLYYSQFEEVKNILHSTLDEEWDWLPDVSDEYGKRVSKITKELYGFNINRNEDWPELISFFKPRIISLDEFWSMARYSFEVL